MTMKLKRKHISLKMIMISSYIILMISTASLIGYILFSNWLSLANETITNMAEDMNNEIYQEINTFINVPMNLNKVKQKLIENGIVDINNEIEREKFFVGVLQTNSDDLYSFSYGTESGEYYGARRNENNVIEIMRNNKSTGGNSWYYSVANDMTAGERVVATGKFDPRTRDWYTAAKETKEPVFSPIYKHFVMDDLTVSAAVPIYDKEGNLQGVLGSHITLSRIDSYLKEIVKGKQAVSLIIEKNSEELVANSLNKANFKTLNDKSIKRTTLVGIENQAIIKAYNDYTRTGERNIQIKDDTDTMHIHLSEYKQDGLNWIVITAVPAGQFTGNIFDNMILTTILTIFALFLSIFIYFTLTKKYLQPVDHLIEVTEKFSQGDLLQRATVVRNDEIGKITHAFNKMAETIFTLVNDLESKVEERTNQLEITNNELIEKKEHLKLILNSTAEAIFGMDLDCNLTFCNASSLRILGYKNQEELLGKNMHYLIHHTNKEGKSIPISECKLCNALKAGKAAHSDEEIYWRSDGTSFDVECYSYPQYIDGKIIGAVITFMDNTERKKNEEHIKYLSYHDSLTGLYNRKFFEDEMKRIDNKKNLPISIIFGDVNGLKLTNDIFGHATGDELLRKSAKILKKVCRDEDIIARVGGDEFAIILPNTEVNEAKKIIDRASREFSKESIVGIRCSISLGSDTKTRAYQKIERVMENAEDRMYKEKMLNRKANNTQMLKTIIGNIHIKCPQEKNHSIRVSEYCKKIGYALNMNETKVRKLKDAGYLHDIGKIVLDEELLKKEDVLTEEENREMEQHSVIGFRILNLFDETMDLAEGILSHHENWNGTGYPKGLKGEEIPTSARIIAIADCYDTMTNTLSHNSLSKEEALNEIKKQSGIKFDPEIVEVFVNIMKVN